MSSLEAVRQLIWKDRMDEWELHIEGESVRERKFRQVKKNDRMDDESQIMKWKYKGGDSKQEGRGEIEPRAGVKKLDLYQV